MSEQSDASTGYYLHPTSIVDPGGDIGEGTRIWHFSHILGNTVIGKNCNLGQNVVVGPDVEIGNGCRIQNNVSVYKGVTLENNVFCGPSVVFTNVFNPRSHIRRMDDIRPTRVKEGASIGANSTIVCGVTIGKYAFVGAGAVVTKDVPDHALVVGNPAKQTGWVCECGEKLNHDVTCPVCKKEYPSLCIEGKTLVKKLPFVDLFAQQQRILPQIKENMEKVLKHGRYIMGPEIDTLEKRLCDLVGVKYTISCSSGTDALVMALMAGGIGPGDAVFTTPFTFFATAEAISMVGATPVFVDIDPETFNISPRNLADAIRAVREDNNAIYPLPDYRGKDAPLSPKAVIAVDLFGLPCDYDALSTIADDNGLLLIEDAAQSLGGAYKGKQAGALGDMGCTSFFPAKPLGCYGDGGAVFTDSDTLAAKLRSIRVHGMGGHKYDNERIGLNARLDTLQAAVLLAKLDIFDEENQLRRQRARTYFDLLNPACPSLFLPSIPKGCVSAWAQYSILAQNTDMRTRIIDGLDKKGIPTMIYYQKPLHLQEAYGGLGYEKVSMPVAEKISSKIFSIPMHPYLDEETIKKVSRAIMDYAQG